MKRKLTLIFCCCAAASWLNAADRPKDWVQFLYEEFDKSVAELFVGISEGNQAVVWDKVSNATRSTFSREEFDRAFDSGAAEESVGWEVCYKRMYSLDPFLSPKHEPIEAYMISIIKYKNSGREEFVQCIWTFDESVGKWRFIGMPFNFLHVPLSLRYPGISVRHPERWPKPGPPVSPE